MSGQAWPLGGADLARLGAMGFPLAFVALPLYVVLPHHYANTYQLPLAWIGALLLTARLGDALIDPHLVVALVPPLCHARTRDQCTDDLFRSERRCGFFRYCSHGITILKQSTKSIPV